MVHANTVNKMGKDLVLSVLVYILVTHAVHVKAECPHLESGLEKWSMAATWDSKPTEGSQVTITKKILLDESPPPLGSITIETGGALIWADEDNITLTVSYILVPGRFQIGSESCKFSKKARIILTGKSDSSLEVQGFGRKFIGVKAGGMLEFHGEDKLSWTKLAHTIPAAKQTCGSVYDHKKTNYDDEWATGIHAMAWNQDGSVYDFGPFVLGETWDDEAEIHLVAFLNGLPDDTVVAMAVHQNLGVEVKSERDWELLFKAVETLGGIESGKSLLRNVKDKEAYAFITVKGQNEYTSEQHVRRKPGKKYTKTRDVHVTLWDLNLKFWVESAVKFEGEWSIPNDVDFQVLSTEIAYPKIEVIDDVSTWTPGDKVVFTSTDFEWRQAEVFTVIECTDCGASNQFKVDGMFKNTHFGELFDNVDERGEVALLSRHIVIEGDMESQCYSNSPTEEDVCDRYDEDVFGGHLKITRGFAAAHIEGVEFHNMGQAAFLGSYPVHFHMCDDVTGAWVRHNSIHHSHARCVTIHGTDNLEVSDNVCYKHKGHGFFLEDSSEQGNKLDGNLGLGTEYGSHILSDMKEEWCDPSQQKFCDAVSTFWITHPNNHITNNVAAGSDQVGFWFLYADRPLGLSAARQEERQLVKEYSARHTPIAEFNNNVAHSNTLRGLAVDGRISSGQTNGEGEYVEVNGVFGTNEYEPRDSNDENGKQVIVYLDRFTGYKNREDNVWVRGGNLVLRWSSLADSSRGITMARSSYDTFTEVQTTVFVGESDNKGMPEFWEDWDYKTEPKPQHQFDRSLATSDPNHPLQGFIFYDGPTYVTDCHFKGFKHWHWDETLENEFPGARAFRSGGAITFRRSEEVFFDPQSAVRGVTFAFCDETEGNKVFDGNATIPGFEDDTESKLQAMFQDEDGSVTGHPGAYVVKNIPFFTSPSCSFIDNWQMSVCPHAYAKVDFTGVDFVKGKYPVYFIRDDAHEFPFTMEGVHGRGYHFMKNKTFTVHFNDSIPTTFSMIAANMENGDFLRFGFCYPKDVTSFTITSWYPHIDDDEPAIAVGSIQQLDDDLTGRAYYWDGATGLLFLKLRTNATRKGWETCPDDVCPNFEITKHGGSDQADCRTSAYGPYKEDPEPKSEMSKPACVTKDAEDRGAGASRQTTSVLTGLPFAITCPVITPDDDVETSVLARGCYKDAWDRDMSGSVSRLYTSMTRRECIKRCIQNDFLYAGLQDGHVCWCDDSFGRYGPDDHSCTMKCAGNPTETCGGDMRNEVFSTGKAPHPSFVMCGPGYRGIVYDSVCYYLGEDKQTFMAAQRVCGTLGGTLASIRSQHVQDVIRHYISKGNGDVWFGLTDIEEEGNFKFLDGTAITGYSNFKDGAPNNWWDGQDYGALVEEASYQWADRGSDEEYRYLCQLPEPSSTRDIVSCGQNNEGLKIESDGNCYAVINKDMSREDAEYECYSRQGVIAALTAETYREVLTHLYLFGLEVDYWVDGAENDKYAELVYQKIFQMEYKEPLDKNGVICLIETLSNEMPCPAGWKHRQEACYLYKGKKVSSYGSAAALCNRASMTILTVESKEENDFVYDMVKEQDAGSETPIVLGLVYSSYTDAFEWLDRTPLIYSDWADGHGKTGLSKGRCSQVRSSGEDHLWENTPCTNNWFAVVCKTYSFN